MASLQELLASLFGGDVAFFSSLWDLIQGFMLIGSAVFAFYYRNKNNFNRAIAKVKSEETVTLGTEVKRLESKLEKKLDATTDAVAYLSDMVVTLTLSSPVLMDKAKEQIVSYAGEIKKLSGVELEDLTLALVNAVNSSKQTEQVLVEKKEEIVQETIKLAEKTEEAAKEVDDILFNVPL